MLFQHLDPHSSTSQSQGHRTLRHSLMGYHEHQRTPDLATCRGIVIKNELSRKVNRYFQACKARVRGIKCLGGGIC